MLDLKEIKNSSSIRLQNGHLVLLTHLRYISTDTASTETLVFANICLCFINVFDLPLSGHRFPSFIYVYNS